VQAVRRSLLVFAAFCAAPVAVCGKKDDPVVTAENDDVAFYCNAARPDNTAIWQLLAQVQFMFPTSSRAARATLTTL
jgi:hypothetical protein